MLAFSDVENISEITKELGPSSPSNPATSKYTSEDETHNISSDVEMQDDEAELNLQSQSRVLQSSLFQKKQKSEQILSSKESDEEQQSILRNLKKSKEIHYVSVDEAEKSDSSRSVSIQKIESSDSSDASDSEDEFLPRAERGSSVPSLDLFSVSQAFSKSDKEKKKREEYARNTAPVIGTDFVSTKLLDAMDFHIHKQLKWPLCKQCQIGCLPFSILGHVTQKHSALKIRLKSLSCSEKQFVEHIDDLESKGFLTSLVPKRPQPLSPPVKGLKIITDCFLCPAIGCSMTKKSLKHSKEHFLSAHEEETLDNFIPCLAQEFKYLSGLFAVKVPVQETPLGSLFERFKEDVLKNFPSLVKETAISKLHDRDMAPYLNTTQWHTLMSPWYEDGEKRRAIKSLVSIPRAPKDSFFFLRHACFMYLSNVKLNAVSKPFNSLRPFQNWPV